MREKGGEREMGGGRERDREGGREWREEREGRREGGEREEERGGEGERERERGREGGREGGRKRVSRGMMMSTGRRHHLSPENRCPQPTAPVRIHHHLSRCSSTASPAHAVKSEDADDLF